jgi:paired small multidrug resistance pump
MAWFYLVMASFGEIFGVTSINLFLKTKKVIWIFFIGVTFTFGFIFLALAMREIPLGTAYAVWTGLGATGAVLMGIVFFKEAAGVIRILCLTCIITGAVGLKIVS